MFRTLALLTGCLILIPSARGEEPVFPDNTPARLNGGLMIIRQRNQTTISLGGVVFSRRVKVITAMPEAPVVTRFLLPSFFHSPNALPLPDAAPAALHVAIPDLYGLLYIDGVLVRTSGKARQLQSPPLPPGQTYPLHLRAAFQVGDRLLIEDREVLIRAGESSTVKFDGSKAISVALPRGKTE